MKLLVEHPYYCNDNNYFSNEPRQEYSTFSDFYEDWHDVDTDYNLIFRFKGCSWLLLAATAIRTHNKPQKNHSLAMFYEGNLND